MTLQKKLNFAVRGKNFLEYKREQIIFLIRKYWKDYKKTRQDFLKQYREVLVKLNQSYKEMGKRGINLISNVSKIQFKPSINVKYLKEYGNLVPKIDFQLIRKEKLPAYSFENTSHYLDELMNLLKNFFEVVIQLAEKEGLMLNYSFNFKKVNRRINGLKNIIIPNYQSDIKKIKEILEEVERENFVRLKKTKDLINKQQSV